MLEAGQRVPMMSKVLINEREVLSIIDQMRISIPEDIREARRVMREREQIPQSAQLEAEQIVARAREQAEDMVRDEEIVRQAQTRAEQLMDESREESDKMRDEMDAYALNMLQDLERRLTSHLTSLERGIGVLERDVPEVADAAEGFATPPQPQ
ncbi:MAG: hypothetical protein QF719_01940 [Chloroflexota bacterium]|nr:hypothetical protein [Chloroflexota bacterium]MDP6756966.1 hypothetical protein [Chloroflexota bacterium]